MRIKPVLVFVVILPSNTAVGINPLFAEPDQKICRFLFTLFLNERYYYLKSLTVLTAVKEKIINQ
jgi:hypothetical protein